MPAVYGLPLGERSPALRSFVRYSNARGPSAQTESDATMAFSVATPQPGSLFVYMFSCEAPNHFDSPDIYGVTQTDVTYRNVHQHGNLDKNYSYSELWLGKANAGKVGGTSVQPGSHRGGWNNVAYAEVRGLSGIVVGEARTWNSGMAGSGTLTLSAVAPDDCMAFAVEGIDSGASGNLGTPTVGTYDGFQSAGQSRLLWRKGRKGQVITFTITGIHGGTNQKGILSMILVR